jgi:hypothetical protein
MKTSLGILTSLIFLASVSEARTAVDTGNHAGQVALSCTIKGKKPYWQFLTPEDGSSSKISAGTYTTPTGDKFTLRDSDIQDGQVRGFQVTFRDGKQAEVPVKNNLLNLPVFARDKAYGYNRCTVVTVAGGFDALAKAQSHKGVPNETLPTTDAGLTAANEAPLIGFRVGFPLDYTPTAAEEREQYYIDRGLLPGRKLNPYRGAPLKHETASGSE